MRRLLLTALATAAAAQSFRKLPSSKEALEKLLREILDRLERIEKGSTVGGVVSFGPVIQVGDLQIRSVVVPGPGGHRNYVVTNTLNGLSTTVNL